MLEETECILNDYLDCFKQYAIDEEIILQEEQKKLRKAYFQANMEENKKKEEEEERKKNQQRQLEQQNRKFKKVGKMPMRKIYAPPVKKVEVKKKAYTAEEEDIILYGLKDFLEA